MKYIGEKAIKKLISLIKRDLATKQDSIAVTGVLERDTTGVINGVETVGATLVETQEATLVDVPNGLLKGDGTTISEAVAGTDYVNSSQAIRYDAAQTLTDAQKTQARGNIGAAPSGYGWGDSAQLLFETNEEFKAWFMQNAAPKCARNTFAASVHIKDISSYRMIIIASGNSLTSEIVIVGYLYNGYELRVTIDGQGNWQPWEWVNPPMQLGVEYRTTERFNEKPVYAKLVDCGALPNANYKAVSIGASGLEKVIDVSGCTVNASDGDFYSIPATNFSSSVHNVGLYATGSQSIAISTQSDRSSYNAHVKVKYTKTTD